MNRPTRQSSWRDDAGVTWNYVAAPNGSARIVRSEGAHGDIAIPDQVAGLRVVEIGQAALSGLTRVTAITCAAGIECIGARAFAGCSTLRRLVLPDKVSNFDASWISGCSALDELVLPGELVEFNAMCDECAPRKLIIGRNTKHVEVTRLWRKSLQKIEVDARNSWLSTDGACLYGEGGRTLEACLVRSRVLEVQPGCKRIAQRALADQTLLEQLHLPEGLRAIEAQAFEGCTALKHMHIPSTVELLAPDACEGAPELLARGLEIDARNPHWTIDDQRVLYRLTPAGRVAVRALKDSLCECRLHALTCEIAEGAFAGCTNLAQVEISASVTRIGAGAFRGCPNLAHIEIDAPADSAVPANSTASTNPTCTVALHGNVLFCNQAALACTCPATGEAAHLDVHDATRLCAHAFEGVDWPCNLVIREGLPVDEGALALMHPPLVTTVVFADPLPDGRTQVDLRLPDNKDGRRALESACAAGVFDAEEFFAWHDRALVHMRQSADKAKREIERLKDPLYLRPKWKERLLGDLKKSAHNCIAWFSANEQRELIDGLVFVGALDAQGLDEAIDNATGCGEVATAAYLLDLKRRAFSKARTYDI